MMHIHDFPVKSCCFTQDILVIQGYQHKRIWVYIRYHLCLLQLVSDSDDEYSVQQCVDLAGFSIEPCATVCEDQIADQCFVTLTSPLLREDPGKWHSSNVLCSIDKVALHQGRLVLGWVTARGQIIRFSM